MASRSQAVAHDARVTLGCFEVAGRSYAIDVSHVREVVRWQPVTPLPQAPELIEGVVDLRGRLVPVIDLGRALGLEPSQPSPRSRIAVADVDGLLVGLVVDSATDVMPVAVADLEDPPALASQTGYDMTRAVVRRAGAEPLPVLALESVLERVYRSALRDRAESP